MLPQPICAKCQRPVELMSTDTRADLGVVRVTVSCHGEHETRDSVLSELMNGVITGGLAFDEKGVA